MLSPSVFLRVRMIGRKDEFTIAHVDHAACVVDLFAVDGQTAIERNVPFYLLCLSAGLDHNSHHRSVHQDTLAAVDQTLFSSRATLRQSNIALADTMDLIAATMKIIRVTQGLIVTSDRIIAEARNWDEQTG